MRILANELVKRANDETRRTRLLEQRVDRFETEINRIETMINAQTGEFKSQLEVIATGIKALSEKMAVMENAISRIEKELTKRATKGEVKQMESYINLMSPIASRFVTKEEMDRAIEEKIVKRY